MPEHLSACVRRWFYLAVTFPRGERREGNAEGDRERRYRSLRISIKGSGFPGSAAALSNDTADQCRSAAHIMAFARRLKPPFEINNFQLSLLRSHVATGPWRGGAESARGFIRFREGSVGIRFCQDTASVVRRHATFKGKLILALSL